MKSYWPYTSYRWRALREQAKSLQGHRCMECGASGIRLDVHHLDEITEQQREEKDEGAAYPSPDRLRVLCVSCHSMETRGIPEAERTRRRGWRQFLDGGSCENIR